MVTCKSKNVYFAMDTTSSYSNDMKIMDNIQKKLENAGFTVHRIHEPGNGSNNGRGPNAMANQYSYMGRKGIRNSIVFNLMNGVDPSNIKEAYQSSSSRGDGYWYSQRYLKPLGNVAVLGWFYGACDCVHEGGSCYNSVRGSETHGGRFYNPKQKMDENGVLCLCEKSDKTGDKVAEAFIKLVKENMGESVDDSTTSDTSSTTTTPVETTVKTLSEQTIHEIYSNAYHQEIMTATTDDVGSFNVLANLPYAGKYNVNINFAGSKYYEATTHTITVENHNGISFQPKLLQTTTTSKYSDGTVETTINGNIEGVQHTLTLIRKRTYQNGVLENETSTVVNNDDVTLSQSTDISSASSSSTVIDDPNKRDPFNQYVEVTADGSPNVGAMKHNGCTFKMVDTTKTYTLTKNHYKEVMDRDSKSLQLCNYIESKYTAFLSKETPTEYQVIHRERWNAIEESIYYYLVKGDGKKYTLDSPAWPEEIIIDFANKKTTLGGSTIDWKGEKCTYWFVADNQDTDYTCGPTASSVCTQVLHKYHSERWMQSIIHAASGSGSAPSAHQKAFKELGFTAEIYSGISNAASWLKQNKPCVYHTYNHYICLADISEDENSILVCNSVQKDGTYGPLSGWRSYSLLKSKSFGSAVRVGLNWTMTEEEKNSIQNFYKSMGGAWEKKPNLNESIRMFYLRY